MIDVLRGVASEVADPETNPRKLLVPCDCAGVCSFLVIEQWEHIKGWDDEFYADVYVRPGQVRLWVRLKWAWRVLKGEYLGHDMTIQRAQMEGMRDWLAKRLEDAEAVEMAEEGLVAGNEALALAEEDDDWIWPGPTVGYCSKCGEAREEFYTCRDGGETIPKETS